MNILIINDSPFYPSFGGIERVTDILTKEFINVFNHNVYYFATNTIEYDAKGYILPAPLFKPKEKANFEELRDYLKEIIHSYKILK